MQGIVRRSRVCTLAVVAVVVTACSTGDATTADTPPIPAPAPAPALTMPAGAPLPPPPVPDAPTVSCSYVPGGRAARPATAPAATPVPTSGTVELTLDTSIGAVPLELDRADAPCAVNSLVSLARQGFYDNVACHRLSTDEGARLYQCGDPSGTGTGGPGYTFADEWPVTVSHGSDGYQAPPTLYPRGTVAMANTGRPDTNGSQFFLVIGDSVLYPEYTVLGTVGEAGLPLLDAAAAAGHDGSSRLGGGTPTTPVVITGVR